MTSLADLSFAESRGRRTNDSRVSRASYIPTNENREGGQSYIPTNENLEGGGQSLPADRVLFVHRLAIAPPVPVSLPLDFIRLAFPYTGSLRDVIAYS